MAGIRLLVPLHATGAGSSGPPPAPTLPTKALAVLIAAVLAAHLLVLRLAPGPLQLDDPLAGKRFVIRTITLNAPDAAAAAPPLPPAAPPSRPTPRPAPRPEPPAARAAERAPQPVAQPAAAVVPRAPPASAPAREAAAPAAPPAPVAAAQPASTPAAWQPPPPSPAPTGLAGEPREPRNATAFSIPGSTRLNYAVTGEVKKQAWNADAQLLWRHDGSQYEARLEVSAFLMGARVQTSAGRITSAGLAPSRFSDRSRSEQATHFVRDRGVIVFSANRPEVALQAGAQDQLSVVLQLASMLAGEPARYPAGSAISIQTASVRDAEPWQFSVDGEEKLHLPQGETAAVRLTRQPRRDFDQKVELWLAPAWGYLPVRMRLTQQNGDFVDQQLRSADKP
jgi:hypothetical protein